MKVSDICAMMAKDSVTCVVAMTSMIRSLNIDVDPADPRLVLIIETIALIRHHRGP